MDKNHHTILIVSKEKAFGFFLKKNIEEKFPGFNVSTTNSGEDAMKIINRKRIDFIITDLILPGMGGLNLFFEVRKDFPHIKIILLYTFLDNKIKNQIEKAGLFRCLEKPFLIENLEGLIAYGLAELEN